ncbi:hypothetical protein BDW74DRAFT_172582 [Aspergillus multicolor]|uniref:uncharacterized protein n=1 Tax=Aspergillus multicolor TaxID=41759 RepID=UPI003CCE188C
MDAISALSFAAVILQFIDFSSKLVASTYEVYSSASGTTIENVHIARIVTDLQDATGDMDVDIVRNTKHERALKDLANKCNALSADIIAILERLRVSNHNSAWKSLKVKWSMMRKSDQLQMERLLADQSQNQQKATARPSPVEEHTFTDSSESVPSVSAGDVPVNGKLEDVKSFLDVLVSKMTSMPAENRILENLYFSSMYDREDAIHNPGKGTFEWFLEGKEGSDDHDESGVEEYLDARQMTDDDDATDTDGNRGSEVDEEDSEFDGKDSGCGKENTEVDNEDSAVDDKDLEVDSEDSEVDSEKGYEGLSSWQRGLFEEEQTRRAAARCSFLNWLKKGSGIFHILGKAGSGKSTLMKFLSSHRRTEEELTHWTGHKRLIIARFFFWKAGDKMQRLVRGLQRALLFEVLKQCPELIPQEAFRLLIKHGNLPSHRFCFIIDGLDEYDGDSVNHRSLAEDLRCWANAEDIKICVSSCPYIEFHITFLDHPEQLVHLHEVTGHDIYVYSLQMLRSTIELRNNGLNYSDLVRDVVRMSDGVFLWAWIVVRSLRTQILRGDPISALRQTLQATPRELNALYTQLLDYLELHNQQTAAHVLILVASAPITYTSVAFRWLDELDNPNFPSLKAILPLSPEILQKVKENVERRVISITKGFLEPIPVHDTHMYTDTLRVINAKNFAFFHRSARDFVLDHPWLGQIVNVDDAVAPEDCSNCSSRRS